MSTTTAADRPRTLRGTHARPKTCDGCRRLAYRNSSFAASPAMRHRTHARVKAQMVL